MTASSSVFSRPDRLTRARYVRVSFPGFEELGELSGVTGCTVTENEETALKASGSLDFKGDTGLTGLDDMVRVYTSSEAGGEVAEVCHGTFLVAVSGRERAETGTGGTGDLYSVLKVLQDRLMPDAAVLRAGEEPVGFARSLIEGAGLVCNADASGYAVSGDHSWDAGTDALTIVNDCMEYAGFSSAAVDAYGGVSLRRYADPADRPTAAVLSDSGRGGGFIIGGRVVSEERDLSSVPNASYVTVSPADAEAEPVTGRAVNDDPESPYSTVSRGREISIYSTYEELEGSADDKALQLLRSAMRVTEKYELDALWYPLAMGDVVGIDYPRAGVSGARASLIKRETDIGEALTCRLTLRRTVDLFEVRSS